MRPQVWVSSAHSHLGHKVEVVRQELPELHEHGGVVLAEPLLVGVERGADQPRAGQLGRVVGRASC